MGDKTLTLYELTDAYKSIFDAVMDDDADLDMLEDTLQCVEAAMEVKADNMVRFVKSLEAEAAACDAEIKRLQIARKQPTKIISLKISIFFCG